MFSLITSCSRSPGISIGLITDLDKSASQVGFEIYQNIQLFLKKTNHSQFKVVALSAATSDEVLINFEEMYDQGIRIFIIGMTSTAMKKIIAEKDTRDCIIFNLFSTSDKYSGIDDSFIRMAPDTYQESLAVSEYINSHFPLNKTLIVYDTGNSAYTLSALKTLTNQINNKCSILGMDAGSFNEKLYRTELKKYRPNIVYLLIGGNHNNIAGIITRHTMEEYPECCLIISPWLNTSAYIENSAQSSEGVIVPTLIPPQGKDSLVTAHNEAFSQYYHSSPKVVYSYLAYESMEILKNCVQNGKHTPAQIKDYILQTHSFSTLIGPLSFDKYGDVSRKYYFYTIKNGHPDYEE
jgi:branched-chain amino acid transport system substrate-binding protein